MGICSITIFQKDASLRGLTWSDKNNMVMASVLSISLFIAIGILLATHLYMVWANQCSVESGILMSYNPFFDSYDGSYPHNLDSGCKNRAFNFSRYIFYQVFGTSPLYWYLPIKTPERYEVCDGINWKL